MALTNAQAAQVQYCYETLEDIETKLRPVDREVADALKRAKREIELITRATEINDNAIVAVTSTGQTAAASLPRRGRLSK